MSLVTPEAIRQAARRLEGAVVRTPLLSAPWLEEAAGPGLGSVRLKCENLQRIGAFKARGAYNMIAALPDTERAKGVITYSSGNHGQAVAYAARRFGVPSLIVMPTTAPGVKVEGCRALGAEVVFEGTTSAERRARAEQIVSQRGMVVIPPFDHPDIIAGQGTIGIEILEDVPDLEVVLVPIGGGGMVSGVGAWVKSQRPECLVVGVEAEVSDAMRQSLAVGEPVTIPAATSLADGLLPVRPGDLTFEHARATVDEVVTVSESALEEAARVLLIRGKLLVEFSGAATVAALLDRRYLPDGRRTVAILSGGNMDPVRIAELARGA